VLLPGVQYLTGQRLDIRSLAEAAHRVGAVAGFDLAHAIGNLPLALHDWNVDFAAWCSYKYLNGGPGATAGAFVHERHFDSKAPRLSGWWGNDIDSRFEMAAEFRPYRGAAGWQVSNHPLLGMVPLQASFAQFAAAGLPALRERSSADRLARRSARCAPRRSHRDPDAARSRGARRTAFGPPARYGARWPRPLRQDAGARPYLRLARTRRHPVRAGAALQLL
jgi:selenocysteine lyase/cysteine desulfurase